jgi:hypothetical protein
MRMIATIAGTVGASLNLDSRPYQQLWAGPETAASRTAEHKANYADHRKDKTLPFGQALAFGTQFGS